MRSMFGAVFPLFARYMFDGIGLNWGMTLLGCVAVVFIPLPFILIRFGKSIRARSNFVQRAHAIACVSVNGRSAERLYAPRYADYTGSQDPSRHCFCKVIVNDTTKKFHCLILFQVLSRSELASCGAISYRLLTRDVLDDFASVLYFASHQISALPICLAAHQSRSQEAVCESRPDRTPDHCLESFADCL
jgi:hypothetical protein